MIELLTTTHDLAWMRKVHRPDAMVHAPIQLPEAFGSRDGKTHRMEPHALCIRSDVACVHRGKLEGVAVAPSDAVLDWAMWTFFKTQGLRAVGTMTLDGFQRWVKDAPKPTAIVCTTCDGTGADPNMRAEEDGLINSCPTCKGEPRYIDEEKAMVDVDSVKVRLADLAPFLPYLAGSDVGLAIAPAVNTLGAFELHLRQYDLARKKDGDWRVTLLAESRVDMSAACGA